MPHQKKNGPSGGGDSKFFVTQVERETFPFLILLQTKQLTLHTLLYLLNSRKKAR